MPTKPQPVRRLIIILGDQLSHDAPVFEGADPSQDLIWMAETREETEHVWCHKLRIAYFLSAMRHFRDELRDRGFTVRYTELTADRRRDRGHNFGELLHQDLPDLKPKEILVTHPGDYRVLEMLRHTAARHDLPLNVLEDTHFYCALDEFRAWAEDRKELLLEHFYRMMRKKWRVLLDKKGKPVGGEWNFDKENRKSFGKQGPGHVKPPRRFQPDALTASVIEMVGKRFADHPGSLEHFDLPVTHGQARAYLRDFIQHRLDLFGPYEDAMWSGEPFLYHSRLSAPLNLKLLDPRECIEKAIEAYDSGEARLASVEGFVRQIIGWREFVRGVYWTYMPAYIEMNELKHKHDLPSFFWDGETDMACVRVAMSTLLNYGYTHHIQRLMVLGEFALLWGVDPRKFHEWHMAMYVDAVDWVSLPNALGMSQYGDGGLVGTKPYCATGKYIDRMSNYCGQCRYDPAVSVGDNACPFTTLYWEFLARHQENFADNRRMALQVRNLSNKSAEERQNLTQQARELREKLSS